MNQSDKQEAPDLLPCPFCGAVPRRHDNVYRYGSIAEHPEGTHCPIENTTIGVRSWNLRARVPSVVATEDLQRELAFYFGAYHGTLDHRQDAAACMENECVRVRNLCFTAVTAPIAAPQDEPREFKNTKEAMLWAQRNNIPTVVPVNVGHDAGVKPYAAPDEQTGS